MAPALCLVGRALRPVTAPQDSRRSFRIERRSICWQIRACNDAGKSYIGEAAPARIDVSSNCVTPVFRISPVYMPADGISRTHKTRILFVSEGNVCRSVYAEAIFRLLIDENGLNDSVECFSKAIKDYNVGEPPDERAVQIATEVGLVLPKSQKSQVFSCPRDIAESDLVIVMDKFNASDLMKEVTLYEMINKQDRCSHRVRRLGEFCKARMIVDIEDPLYGNMGGPEEEELLRQVLKDVKDSCTGLLEFLLQVRSTVQESETLKQGVARELRQMQSMDWLVPPIFQKQ